MPRTEKFLFFRERQMVAADLVKMTNHPMQTARIDREIPYEVSSVLPGAQLNPARWKGILVS
jgi:hypothetical protein